MEKLLQKALFFLVLLNFIFIPLYPKIPFIVIKETFVAIRIEDFLIALTLLTGAVHIIVSKSWKKLIKSKLFFAIFLFFAIGGLSLFSVIFLTHTIVSAKLGILHF